MKKLLLTGLIALGLFTVGCSDNDNEPIDNGKPGSDMVGHLTLSLHSGSMSQTRTSEHQPGREVGEGKEIVINNVTVVITDANGAIKEVKTPELATTGGTSTKQFEIQAGTDLKVFALVNNATAIKENDFTGKSITDLVTATTAAEIAGGFKSESFFMTNELSNPVTKENGTDRLSKYLDAGADLTIAAGEQKTVAIAVDRLAARVDDVTTAPNIDGLKGDVNGKVATYLDAVEVVGFVPLNANASMNPIQTWEKIKVQKTVVKPAEDVEGYVLSTPLIDTDTPTTYFFGVDNYKEDNAEGIGIKDLTKVGDYVKKAYVTENRPTITGHSNPDIYWTSPKRGATTGVIYRVQAKLNGNNAETFYVYADNIYAKGQEAELNKELAKAGVTLPDGQTEFSIEEYRAANVRVYENGVMYYTYMIKDNNTKYQLDGKDYYGVFRNSIYKLNVTTLSKLGDDVPEGDKDKEDPVDPENAYLTVIVNVNDWVLNTIDIPF